MSYVQKDWDYRRCCDLCGRTTNASEMRKVENMRVCDVHSGQRLIQELDRLNANFRVPPEMPVPDPKPQNFLYPNTLVYDEGPLMNFIDRAVRNGTRYEDDISGIPSPQSGLAVETFGWCGIYLYDLLNDPDRQDTMTDRAQTLLGLCADGLLALQVGFGISTSSTRANSAFYGAFLDTGETEYDTDDIAVAGLTMLYAFRTFGTLQYRDSARAAASYLRNVQAIGQFGTNFTSSDSAGTARLNTGAVTSLVSATAGFYSDHRFYLSGLLTLRFWKELTTTDGDQSVGATVAVTGFDQIPAQLMSTSMTDMREFWTDGVLDSAGDTLTGLSATTPREMFNAYPATKANFTITGTGRWEFADGDASDGTSVSGQNFAAALNALYVYEGASSQVTAVDDWLRSFTGNADYETPDGTSNQVLWRSLTGVYDPTICLSTLLLVRDADDSYASVAMNGSALYDWGAFGLLSQLWAARHSSSFMISRAKPLNIQQRFQDGTPSDGLMFDRIEVIGRSGLTMQTYMLGNANAAAVTGDDPGGADGSFPNTIGGAWYKADAGVTLSGANVIQWNDNLPLAQHVDTTIAGFEPTYVPAALNGLPAISMGSINNGAFALDSGIYRTSNLKRNSSADFTSGDARTIYVVMQPLAWNHGASTGTGAGVCCFRRGGGGTIFGADAFDWNNDGQFYGYTNNSFDRTAPTQQGLGALAIFRWVYDGTNVEIHINGVPVALANPLANPADNAVAPGFYVGRSGPIGGGHVGAALMGELRVFPGVLSATDRLTFEGYLGRRWGFLPPSLGQVNDAVRASQFGRNYRESLG